MNLQKKIYFSNILLQQLDRAIDDTLWFALEQFLGCTQRKRLLRSFTRLYKNREKWNSVSLRKENNTKNQLNFMQMAVYSGAK